MNYLKTYWAVIVVLCSLVLASCFKDEPLNNEADILVIKADVQNPENVFYNVDNAKVAMPYSGNGDSVIFIVKEGADLSAVKLHLTVSKGATVSPASSAVLDFSDGQRHEFMVTSEDGLWHRTYRVGFDPFERFYHFSLDDGRLSDNGKYFVWNGLCTANQGFSVARSSAKPEEYPTVFDANGYKGGCAQLRTVSTGAWGAMSGKRLAAGNIYVGTFDISNALTQTLKATHFGKPIDLKPLTYSGFYRYKAGAYLQNASGNRIEGTDSCAIYAVVYKNHDAEGKELYLTGEDIMTNPNIVGMARARGLEQVSEWTPFSIDFNYTEPLDPVMLANHGYSMVIVCSASKNGDLFEGAVGSTLWVDELNITYEE